MLAGFFAYSVAPIVPVGAFLYQTFVARGAAPTSQAQSFGSVSMVLRVTSLKWRDLRSGEVE